MKGNQDGALEPPLEHPLKTLNCGIPALQPPARTGSAD